MGSILLNLDLGTLASGLSLTAKIYNGSTLSASVAMTENPASSGRYVGSFTSPGTAASYDGSIQDASGLSYGTISFQTDASGNNVNPPGDASGLIIDQTSLSNWMGGLNLAILSQQDIAATTIDSTVTQLAINGAEARCYGILGQLQCCNLAVTPPAIATFFKIPLTVGGVPIKSSASITALPIMQTAAHQYAGFLLNKWRQLLSMTDDDSGGPVIYRTAKGWEKDADANMRMIIRWAQGFTDGCYVDLDLNLGANLGAPYRSVKAPMFAGPCVGPDGMPYRRIVNSLDWWGLPWVLGSRGIFALSE